jgi:Zn-dependent protease with chaperone function
MESTQPQSKAQKALQEARERRAWFIDLVRQQEEFATRDPEGYKRTVRGLAALGYAYIFGALLVAIALLVGIVLIMVLGHAGALLKLLIVAVLLVIGILRSLWVKFDPPDGLLITRDQAPTLYREVDSIADGLGAPRPDEIRINEELNAAALQLPRLGIFGWYRNILYLGLPLLLAFTPDEARSVIAHEFGHFSGQHGRFGAWIYRINRTWEQLQINLASQGRGSWLFGPFFNWFQPRFDATTFALRRANEYEADAAAAKVAGSRNAAMALMRLRFVGKHLNLAFWQPFYEKAKIQPAPPSGVFQAFPDAARTATDSGTVEQSLKAALLEKTDYDDTHPSLADRLRGMKENPDTNLDSYVEELSKPVVASAAEHFFGPNLPAMLGRVEETYLGAIRENWRAAFEHSEEQRKRLSEIEAAAAQKPLTEEEQVERAALSYQLNGVEAGEPLLRALTEQYPQNPAGWLLLGEILLDRDDDTGVEYVEKARALDHDYAEAVIQRLGEYYHRRGEVERFEALKEHANEHFLVEHMADSEAREMTLADTFLPAELTYEQITALQQGLQTVKDLGRAYVVRKLITINQQTPVVVFVFPRKKLLESENEWQKLLQAATQIEGLPPGCLVYSAQNGKQWYKRLDEIPGAKVFDSKG